MGLQAEHPMIGRDLTQPGGDRAMMQYGENYGYLKDDALEVLEPHRDATQYRYQATDSYTPMLLVAHLVRDALAHVLWPTWLYCNISSFFPSFYPHPYLTY